MVQHEVGKPLAAEPGGKAYGTLTLWVGHRYTVEIKQIVPPGAFQPPPKVDSAIVLMRAREKPRVEVSDEEGYFKLIRAAFAMGRKTLLNNLRSYVPAGGEPQDCPEVLERAGVDPGCRSETIDEEDFTRIFNNMKA
jgi:16S rRNA (adenine1518-N6/adenine1519-N6)-dimethyltransferase